MTRKELQEKYAALLEKLTNMKTFLIARGERPEYNRRYQQIKAEFQETQKALEEIRRRNRNEQERQKELFTGCTEYELKVIARLRARVGEDEWTRILEEAKAQTPVLQFITEEEREFVKYDKMMRRNYNRFAGGMK